RVPTQLWVRRCLPFTSPSTGSSFGIAATLSTRISLTAPCTAFTWLPTCVSRFCVFCLVFIFSRPFPWGLICRDIDVSRLRLRATLPIPAPQSRRLSGQRLHSGRHHRGFAAGQGGLQSH